MSFHPASDYGGIAAAAGGAYARTVERVQDLEGALDACLHAVQAEGRCAVLDARLARF
jgi:acetolactate synthase-1/2/3 large subunit